MAITIDLRVPVGRPLPEVAEFIRRCEDAGFDGVGIHDHQDSGRDVFVALAMAARETSRMTLYPAVTNPVTRHPMVLASLANSLNEVAPGRTRVVVGSGDQAVSHLGRPKASLGTVREAITTMQGLLTGHSLPFGTSPSEHLIWSPDRPVPVYVAAAGPRTIQLAGELGDGAFLWTGLHPGSVRTARELVAQGARRAGRDPDSVPIIAVAPIRIEKDLATAHGWARQWMTDGLGRRTLRTHRSWLEAADIHLPPDATGATLSDEQVARICDCWGLFGPPEYITERIQQAHEEAGVSHIFLMSAHSWDTQYVVPERELEDFARVVFPRLGRGVARASER